jgi:hypothetical protein
MRLRQLQILDRLVAEETQEVLPGLAQVQVFVRVAAVFLVAA